MNKQIIAFERNKVYVSLTAPADASEKRLESLKVLTEELKRFNLYLPAEAILFLSDSDILDIFNEVIPKLAEKFYPQGNWAPLYPGFPDQVLSKTERELMEDRDYIYDTLNYEEFLNRNPWYTETEKAAIEADAFAVKLGLMKEADMVALLKSIVSSGNSISQQTKDELLYLLDEYQEIKLPEDIPFKETLCLVMSKREEYLPKTINDLLRYSLFRAGASPALEHVPEKIKDGWNTEKPNPDHRKIKLSRSLRKEILRKLEAFLQGTSLKKVIPDAKKFYGHWVLLSEFLHPGEYGEKYPKTNEFFTTLKTNEKSKKYKTWESMVQNMYNNGADILDIAKTVSTRPGELVRRLDSLLRRAKDVGKESDLLDIFLDTEGMKNKTLLELLTYYDKRNSGATRMISVKGSTKKKALEPLAPLPKIMIETVRDCVERKILLNIDHSIKEADLTGKVVYLDPDIKYLPVPRDMRTASTAFPAGMRFAIPEDKNYIRLYTHWIDKTGGEDLDLHAAIFNQESERNIGWNSGLRDGSYIAHSGDVRLRKGDCSEFVDIDIQGAIDAGWDYVMMSVHNYIGRGLNTLDNWLGYVLFDKKQPVRSTWIPSNPDCTQKVTSKESNIVAWIFDLKKRQAILVNSAMYGVPVNNLTMNRTILNFYVTESTFTSWNILQRYYLARGAEIVDSPIEGVDISVTLDEVAKDYTKVLEILG